MEGGAGGEKFGSLHIQAFGKEQNETLPKSTRLNTLHLRDLGALPSFVGGCKKMQPAKRTISSPTEVLFVL